MCWCKVWRHSPYTNSEPPCWLDSLSSSVNYKSYFYIFCAVQGSLKTNLFKYKRFILKCLSWHEIKKYMSEYLRFIYISELGGIYRYQNRYCLRIFGLGCHVKHNFKHTWATKVHKRKVWYLAGLPWIKDEASSEPSR